MQLHRVHLCMEKDVVFENYVFIVTRYFAKHVHFEGNWGFIRCLMRNFGNVRDAQGPRQKREISKKTRTKHINYRFIVVNVQFWGYFSKPQNAEIWRQSNVLSIYIIAKGSLSVFHRVGWTLVQYSIHICLTAYLI
jgi:hypothetical protein